MLYSFAKRLLGCLLYPLNYIVEESKLETLSSMEELPPLIMTP